MEFNAKVVLMKKEDEKWTESIAVIKSIDDLKGVFHPFENETTQVDIDKYRKVYYNYGFLGNDGVAAKVKDIDDNMHYMCSPLLIVQCDDEKPINIESDILNSIKELIDFC